MTRDQLIASLEYTGDVGGVQYGDDSERGYFDWSTPLDRQHDGAGRRFEMGDGDPRVEYVILDLTWDEIRQMHAALTATLLTQTK